MNNSDNRKSFVKRHFYLICANAFVTIIFILGFIKGSISISQLIKLFFLSLFIINIWPIIDGVWSVYGIEKKDFDKGDQRKILIATLIMFPILCLLLFFVMVKEMIWVMYIVIVICNVFMFFIFTIKKAAKMKKLERDGSTG
ncbi:MAG: hypothetical protein GY777_22275 [Candidatus Brocadiaceae bacterium]|nr:hypothetical protein [Candidatus Brocadiaceae bacterium]